MDTADLFKILIAVAPTVTPKLIKIFKADGGKNVNERNINTILTAMIAEQNKDIMECMNSVNKKLSQTSEDITIILRRTEALATTG